MDYWYSASKVRLQEFDFVLQVLCSSFALLLNSSTVYGFGLVALRA